MSVLQSTSPHSASGLAAPPEAPSSYRSEAGELARRIERGDPAAFETLFRTFAPALYTFLTHYVGSSAVAEDLVQDLFLAIWDHRAALRIEGSLRTYLFTAARNRALNYLKHERVVERFRSVLLERGDASDPSAPGEADFLTALEMQGAIDALPPRCRLIFTMSRQDGLSYNQIATTLAISVKTVEVQMGRAMRSLRAHHRRSLA